jgi:hypothetical protein
MAFSATGVGFLYFLVFSSLYLPCTQTEAATERKNAFTSERPYAVTVREDRMGIRFIWFYIFAISRSP